jgi:hypothetical protein
MSLMKSCQILSHKILIVRLPTKLIPLRRQEGNIPLLRHEEYSVFLEH